MMGFDTLCDMNAGQCKHTEFEFSHEWMNAWSLHCAVEFKVVEYRNLKLKSKYLKLNVAIIGITQLIKDYS